MRVADVPEAFRVERTSVNGSLRVHASKNEWSMAASSRFKSLKHTPDSGLCVFTCPMVHESCRPE